MGFVVACVTQRELEDALDQDDDGFGDMEAGGDDCDDGRPEVFPGAPEQCGDGLDNNCDGMVDDLGVGNVAWFPDTDGDGFGRDAGVRFACPEWPDAKAGGWSRESMDCDDTDATVFPGAFELCDGLDNDCNANVDDGGHVATTPDGQTHDAVIDGVIAAILGDQPLSLCDGVHPLANATLRSGERLTLQGIGASRVTLEGGPAMFTVIGGELVLRDLTLRGTGSGTLISTASATDASTIDIADSLLRDAGIALQLTSVRPQTVVLVNTEVRSNGSGLADQSALRTSGILAFSMSGGVVAGNEGDRGGAFAYDVGAAGAGDASVAFTDTEFRGNTANGRGGALFADFAPGNVGTDLSLQGVTLTSNDAGTEGGALHLDGKVSLEGVEVVENTADVGAGLFVAGGSWTVDGASRVVRNAARVSSGGAHVEPGAVLALNGADFGVGFDDNQPSDLRTEGGADAVLGAATIATCTSTGCSQ
ncbi:MAG: putative metal-binding motif-containing protein [Myxococcota bacterium]